MSEEIRAEDVEAFAGNMFGHLVGAATVVCSDLAHKLGFYSHLAGTGGMTAVELAKVAGTNERLTRELLDQQASAGVLIYESGEDKYVLSDAGAMVMAEQHSPAWLAGGLGAVRAMYVGLDQVEAAFRGDGGVPWGDHHPCLFDGTLEFFRPCYEHHLVQEFIPALRGGETRVGDGAIVADIGCGAGLSTLTMAAAFPNSSFVGIDFHAPSVEMARIAAAEQGLSNVTFEVESATKYQGVYDLICFFDCMHDMGDPVGIAQHAKSQLSDNGSVMLIEPFAFDTREENHAGLGAAFYGFSSFFCTPCSLSQEVGRGMGAQSGEPGMSAVFAEAGYALFNRIAETPSNIVYEAFA
jgi:SAM-dependent methyltransferase|tara:strand:- start:1242 stop:2300 length:1059 start_codon:yes stop_codon:yes gene_type:complete